MSPPHLLLATLSLLLWLRSGDAAACVIEAQAATLDELVIAPPGEESFTLRIERLPLEVRPEADGSARISVLAPLVFSGTRPLADLELRMARRSSIAEGRIVIAKDRTPTLAAGAKAQSADALAVHLPLRELTPEVAIEVPCADLTIAGDSPSSTLPALSLPDSKISYIETDTRLPLHAQPADDAPLWMKFRGPLQILERKGEWLRVLARWTDGSRLRGWIPASGVTIQRGRPEQSFGVQVGSIGLGHCGRSHAPRRVAFSLRAGAAIHNRANGAIWAHSATRVQVEAFPIDRADGWLQIAAIDGLPPQPCSEHANMWVHASDLVWTATVTSS